ncbi:glycosyltransferase family 39 protein [Bacillus sp. FJAT-42315]|uniref:glycosyltransferase family 39 protein n=1 Tax=Bacillus sp. FJAT-42315 TaxID=2014077 RepID=UPI000C24859D|nr:glycosyltransferase family 39 protein [Bacillus sp. FJAT-42315]
MRTLYVKIMIIALLALWGYIFALPTVIPSTWDQVDFALGVIRFDLLTMQPHFPGYPFFILAATVVNAVVKDAEFAISMWNKAIYLTSLYPLFKLAKHSLPTVPAFLTAIVIHCLPFSLIMMQQPISEPMALSIFFWFLWSLMRAFERGTREAGVWPMLLLAILFGVRLSYVAAFVAIIVYWIWYWKKTNDGRGIVFQLVLLIAANLAWVSALISNVGSLKTFIDIALGFTDGHFTEWGGTAIASDASLFERIHYLLFYNMLWSGTFVEHFALTLVLGGTLLAAFFNKNKEKSDIVWFSWFAVFLSYFLWVLFAQNIDKPRHSLPLISLLPLLLLTKVSWKRWFTVAVAITIVVEVTIAIPLLKEQANDSLAVIQATNYLEEVQEPFIVYTWEETRVFEYRQVSFPHKRLFSYDHFIADASLQRNRHIYLTDKVVHGFEQQTGQSLTNQLTKKAEFTSNHLFDPVYDQVILYEWTPSGGGKNE